MKAITVTAALLLAATTAAFAQGAPAKPAAAPARPAAARPQAAAVTTVNSYTPAQRSAAEAAVKAAGFTPGAISYAQGGSIFINGEKGGEKFMITVTADGKVVPGIATKPYAGNPNAPATPAGGRGGRGGGGGEE